MKTVIADAEQRVQQRLEQVMLFNVVLPRIRGFNCCWMQRAERKTTAAVAMGCIVASGTMWSQAWPSLWFLLWPPYIYIVALFVAWVGVSVPWEHRRRVMGTWAL